MTDGGYRFDELGSLQFDRLCLDLLGSQELDWEEREFGRVGLAAEGAIPPGSEVALEAPTLVVVAWLRRRKSRRRSPARLKNVIEAELAMLPQARSILVLTNAPQVRTGSQLPAVTLGPEQLGELIDADGALRLRIPTVLGIRDAGALIATDVAGTSTADLPGALDLARVFVPTRTYAQTLEALSRFNFAVLTGPPEMGKTAIARTVALAQATAGWEAHECIRPEQLWAAFSRERPQVFVADDAFGSTEYRPEAAERWALELDRVLRAMDERHWLIWTSRPAPLKAGLRRIHREHGVERFPQPAEVQVDAATLTVDEKALILFRHARAAAAGRPASELVQRHGWQIVGHRHFTPERIRRFVAERLDELARSKQDDRQLAAAVVAEIQEPTIAMGASFDALEPAYRDLLVALLDAPPGPVSERDLLAALRRHSRDGVPRPPAELLDRLADHFVRLVHPTSVAWVHPSWRDLVVTRVAGDVVARRRFLERCGLEGTLLALSVGGGAAGERQLPLLREDADWDLVAARIEALAPELDDPSAIRLLQSLDAAAEADVPTAVRAEIDSLATLALTRLGALWGERGNVLPIPALEAWLRLAERVSQSPPRPPIAPTWIELLPTGPVALTSRDDLASFDDWLALADVLLAHAPDELDTFGFPERQSEVIGAFVADATSTAASDETQALVTQILRRIRRVAPSYGATVLRAEHVILERPDEWFEVRFPNHPRRPEPSTADQELVERVLRDL